MKPTRSLGLLREVKSKFERRVAVTPAEVKKLVQKNVRVLVQPCQRRVFKDVEYAESGATLTEDVSEANCIIGVKEIPPPNLLQDHSYLCFAHVIKAQPANMPFLDACLSKNIRFFDYEVIRAAPKPDSDQIPPRLVAFGRFAGLAGMITGMRGFGEHLLAMGFSTPFLYLSSSYMYPSYDNAQSAVAEVAEHIRQYGLPREFGPCTFCFTGGGNVSTGAMELFKQLPHEFVSPEDLPNLHKNFDNHKVYGCAVPTSSLVEPITRSAQAQPFDEQHYFENPELYRPVFHEKIAPYTRVLVNAMYWDHRYPRLITNSQMADLHFQNPYSVMAVFDITCDPLGSVEFLRKTTTSDQPYFTYDPLLDEVNDTIDGQGVLVLGVDALPAELPRESSQYFSSVLYPFLESLATADNRQSYEDQSSDLPIEMYNAMITTNQSLTPPFKYIGTMRRQSPLIKEKVSTSLGQMGLRIDGHLFDSGLINQLLDYIENAGGEYRILELQSRVNTSELQKASRLVLQITADETKLEEINNGLRSLVNLVPRAKAVVRSLPFVAQYDRSKEVSRLAAQKSTLHKITQLDNRVGEAKKVLVLGSGFVARPVVDYLCYSGNNSITVASNQRNIAQKICESHPFAKSVYLDASDTDKMDDLISKSDIVISLLPASLHVPIAEKCLSNGIDMVTASYISPEMSKLNAAAQEKNITILNEIGLDPGLDHTSALQIIRQAENRGEKVKSFSSVCGGLPAPEAVNNPLGYKFSWSPMGVLTAAKNAARFMSDGHVVNVDGEDLLKYVRPLDHNPYPSLALELIPNRNSLTYMSEYNLPSVDSMYRGTLRYSGFCDIMYGFKTLGLLNSDSFPTENGETWKSYLGRLTDSNGNIDAIEEFISGKQLDWEPSQLTRFLDAMQWMEMFDSNHPLAQFDNPISAFCDLLEEKLSFETGERDMVLMYHRIGTECDDGRSKMYESSMLVYGDDEYSAMSRTVGFPVAVASQLILDGKMKTSGTGVVSGGHPIVIEEIMNTVGGLGIPFVEKESLSRKSV